MMDVAIDGHRWGRANNEHEIAKINAAVASALIANIKALCAMAAAFFVVANDDADEETPLTTKSPVTASIVAAVDNG